MPVRAVFFDLYNTLAGFEPPRDVIQSRAAAEFGLRLTREGVNAGYLLADAFMATQNAGPRPVRAMSAPERDAFFARFEQQVLGGAGHDVGLERAGEVWARVRTQKYKLALFEDVVPGLSALRALGLRLGVLSNLDTPGDQLLANFGLQGRVDFAITSRDAGAEKPHPPIFLAALARAGVSAGEAVHVGDQLDSDIAGALSAGLHPVLMDRYNGHPCYTAHPRVEGMAGLPRLLATM